jgi:hypothetical protein
MSHENHEVPRRGALSAQNKIDNLALRVAQGLGESHRLPLYRRICRKFDEPIIRRAFGEVRSVPDYKIKKSRAALFAYLVRKYAESEK